MKNAIINEKPHTDLKTSDFFYHLPEELIAQHPMEKRDTSRLMVLDRQRETVEHKHFFDILDYLNPDDVLVINDSKVIPARLFGHVQGREEALVELLLLRQRDLDAWETLVKPGKRARIGMRIVFGGGILVGEVTDIVEEGNRIIRFEYDHSRYTNIYEILQQIGLMPLPPYITEQLKDNDRYQTVYAREEGSAAAPTAGLHFTPELLEKIKAKGVAIDGIFMNRIANAITLKSDKSSRCVKLEYDGFPYLGIWQQYGADTPFICVEPWCGLPDYEGRSTDITKKNDMFRLAPKSAKTVAYAMIFED